MVKGEKQKQILHAVQDDRQDLKRTTIGYIRIKKAIPEPVEGVGAKIFLLFPSSGLGTQSFMLLKNGIR